ncbi:epoxide hydrolase 4 [Neodiprion pinetum]|uniref:epoxide hydrolase 4-like n=1 Tax=Neodiprion fabricii TaxID=2872261 RepID=UPI001ED97C9E|nr:epoxide hydrolase 4-like [Neodiprion fabricii]XP_046484707.1 epoxide hydrolase 4-like [Neodiprion pinetum]XP_046621892.1 epoxide hydrolase 4-like [Neodiprion virginianus]
MEDLKIVNISVWETTKLHFLTFVYGVYLIVKRFIKWAWNPNQFFVLQERDNPPLCLVDNSLGKHSYVKLKGVKLHYVEAGDRDKPLLLLLHGFPDCWLSWREQIPALAEHHRVVALDLKGFGDSDKPANRRAYRIETLLDELKQLILALGVKNCSIIGHDLGGLLGWYMVALHEELVYKFVAISSPHPNFYWEGFTGDSIFNDKWIHFSQLPFLPEIDALKEDLSIITDTYKHLQINQTDNEKNYVEAYKYSFSRKEDWTGAINYYRNLPFARINPKSPDQILTRTLLIIGNQDPKVSLENVVKSSEHCEKFSLKVICDAQHFPHQEKPDIVNQTILKFLIGTPSSVEKTANKNIVSSWLGSISSTVKYGNQMIDAVHKKTNGMVNGLPGKIRYMGQTPS